MYVIISTIKHILKVSSIHSARSIAKGVSIQWQQPVKLAFEIWGTRNELTWEQSSEINSHKMNGSG